MPEQSKKTIHDKTKEIAFGVPRMIKSNSVVLKIVDNSKTDECHQLTSSDGVIQRVVNLSRGGQLSASMVQWNNTSENRWKKDKYETIEERLKLMTHNYFNETTITEVEIDLMSPENAQIRGIKSSDEDLIQISPNKMKITLGEGLFIKLSVGEVIGIINHEFNVHHRANYEAWSRIDKPELAEMYQSRPLDRGGIKAPIDYGVVPSNDSQPDHVFASQDAAKSLRAKHYMQSTVDAVKVMLSNPILSRDPFASLNPFGHPKEYDYTKKIVVDVICFYLFDVMRMQLENIKLKSDDLEGLYDNAMLRMEMIIQQATSGIDFKDWRDTKLVDSIREDCTRTVNTYYKNFIETRSGISELFASRREMRD